MDTIKFDAPNLTEMIQNSLAKNFSKENLQEKIDKCCADVIGEAIEGQFRWDGKIKAQLNDHVKDTMNIDTKLLPVPEYTKLVGEGFKRALVGMEDETIRKEAEKLMGSILQSAPREIALSDIVDQYTKEISNTFEYELKEVDRDIEYDDGRAFKTFYTGYENEDMFPDTLCLSEHRILTLDCADISDNDHRLLLSIRIEDDGRAILKSANRDSKHTSGINNMDMKDWCKASGLSKLLYKMVHRGTKIVMDERNIPEDFEIELEADYS